MDTIDEIERDLDTIDEIERDYYFRRQVMHYKFNIGTAASICVIYFGFMFCGFNFVNGIGSVISTMWLVFSIHKLKKIINERNADTSENPISNKNLLDD